MGMMKKVWLCIALAAITTTSCDRDFLDQIPDDRLTLNDVFINRINTESFLANIYGNIPDEAWQRIVTSGDSHGNSGPWTGASDEAEYVWATVISNAINVGDWSTSSAWVR